MSKEEEQIILNCRDIDFIKHFIIQYNQNMRKGRLDDSNHDAVAILLYLQDLLGMDGDWTKRVK